MMMVLFLESSEVAHLAERAEPGEYRSLCWKHKVGWDGERGQVTLPDWRGEGGGAPAGTDLVRSCGRRICRICLARYRADDSQLFEHLAAIGQVP